MGWGQAVRRALRGAAAVAGPCWGPGLGPGPGPGRGGVRAVTVPPRAPQCAQAQDWRSATAIYDFHALDIDGNDVSLQQYRGFVCIITNVASK
uniref:Phospholipid hydroperoxide glutathione peroxidase n=1 Tax=Amazona collaria TaxID=241587 RepID=A0A8B9FPL7_9PSIT